MYEVYITADQVLILEHPVRSPSILSFSICQKIYQETFQGEVKGYFARSLLLLCVSVKIVCVNSTNERLTSQIKYWPTLFPPTSPCSFPLTLLPLYIILLQSPIPLSIVKPSSLRSNNIKLSILSLNKSIEWVGSMVIGSKSSMNPTFINWKRYVE